MGIEGIGFPADERGCATGTGLLSLTSLTA